MWLAYLRYIIKAEKCLASSSKQQIIIAFTDSITSWDRSFTINFHYVKLNVMTIFVTLLFHKTTSQIFIMVTCILEKLKPIQYILVFPEHILFETIYPSKSSRKQVSLTKQNQFLWSIYKYSIISLGIILLMFCLDPPANLNEMNS